MAEETKNKNQRDIDTSDTLDYNGYRFVGWYANEELTERINPGGKLPKATLFYQKWLPILYPVRYVLYGAENDSRNPRYVTVESGVLRLFPAKKPGYTFDSWVLNGRKIRVLPEGQTKAVILYATFKEPQKVHFETFGGGVLKPQPISKNQADTMVTPRKMGCDFDGWFLDEEYTQPYLPGDQISEACTLYAKWSPTYYEIRYKAEGAIVSDKNPSRYCYFDKTLPLYPAFKRGYIFEGWYDIRGRKVTLIQHHSLGNLTLTAHFNKDTRPTKETYFNMDR